MSASALFSGEEICVDLSTRMMLGTLSVRWSQERREQYLLAISVIEPLSVDRYVWPYAESGIRVALTLSIERPSNCDREQKHWAAVARSMPSPTKFLGYDVADIGRISGLSNCAYVPDEREALRSEWGPKLNDHHLFTQLEPARAFRRLTDARVPEHAPFYVYGIYTLG
jgi:hypothetical protein